MQASMHITCGTIVSVLDKKACMVMYIEFGSPNQQHCMLVVSHPSSSPRPTDFHGEQCSDEKRLVPDLRKEDKRKCGEEPALAERPIDQEFLQ